MSLFARLLWSAFLLWSLCIFILTDRIRGNFISTLGSTLTGPTKVSTIAKTSSDWDTFKDVTGVNEELELNNQNGYLTKKDFLNRCDVRQFEQEKEKREIARAKRGM